jgi:glutathione peroxidase
MNRGMTTVHDFTAKTIDGKDGNLADYRGKVMLIVNVASKCGLTPQYRGLEELHEKYGAKGLVVLGFPANEFGAQEPGSDTQIKEFCTTNYGVKFPMFSKIVVKGAGIHPLFAHLTEGGGDIKWNFAKFLIGRDGKLAARFEPNVEPTSAELTSAIEKALS